MSNLQKLKENGYLIIPNIINKSEIDEARNLFFNWKNQILYFDNYNENYNFYGIIRDHQIGHSEMAWFLRTNNNIQNIFKELWNTNELIVSFDGCCYMPKDYNYSDETWTHTDQASNNSKFECYQSFVSLTDNDHRTLMVYEKSHLMHEDYFKNKKKDSNRFQLIDEETLNNIKSYKKILNVKKGDFVIWDSRTFHQSLYSEVPEERLVQYLCFFPKNHKDNTKSEQGKRLKYFNDLRTTTHWPCKIKVNPLNDQIIDYSKLPSINLDKYFIKIIELL